jgi:hypothetical protein
MTEPTLTEPTVTQPFEPQPAASQERHPFRAGSFVVGLLALLVAGLYLLDGSGALYVDGGVAAALLLLVAGGALVLKTVSRLTRRSGSG